jgi:TPR repeat protein
MHEIQARAVQQLGCSVPTSAGAVEQTNQSKDTPQCAELLFQIATTLVFYNEDPARGLKIFQRLANNGHVDAMVACGVILVEGLGVPADEVLGVTWLQKAVELDSPQACYELGTAYYTGIADVLEEDSYTAFALFAKAAAVGHVASIYMMADCLATGEGVEQNVAKAVPLFYQAAEQGHRYSRQRIRELLSSPEYQEES